MAVSADGRVSLSATGQLRGATGLAGRSWKMVKFCNGELMGKKLKMGQPGHGVNGKSDGGRHVSMSLATDIAGESKVKLRSCCSLDTCSSRKCQSHLTMHDCTFFSFYLFSND